MARIEDHGVWWKYTSHDTEVRPHLGKKLTLIIAKEDFYRDEIEEVGRAVGKRLNEFWAHKDSGHLTIPLSKGKIIVYYSEARMAGFTGSVTLPHPYPGGVRSDEGLRTSNPSQVSGYSPLDRKDQYVPD